jgi:putative ABC transport system permease protein
MPWLRSVLTRFTSVLQRERRERELVEELESHLQMHLQDNLRAGMSVTEAQRNARMKLGGIAQTQAIYRERCGLPVLEVLVSDVRFGARLVRKNLGFTIVGLFTLALGIGANVAIFSVVDSVLLQPLSFREPQQLYRIREIVPQMAKSYPLLDANLQDFWIWQKDVHSFEQVAIVESASRIYSGNGEAEEIYGLRGSANLLDVLGARPALGRTFTSEEDQAGRGKVVMLTDPFWQSHFHADTSVIGKPITLDEESRVVVGILPASFHFPKELTGATKPIDFYEPLDGPRFYEEGLIGEFDFAAIARLKPGIRADQALTEFNVVQERIAVQAKENVDLRAQLFPLAEEIVGRSRRGLLLLLVAVGAVLLMVCVNLANLFSSRVPARMREAAIRTALGATRARLIRQMLAESLLLSLSGGLLGIWLAWLGIQWLVHRAPVELPRINEVALNGHVLWFAFLLSTLTGVLFGILPALNIARSEPQEVLKSSGPTTTESGRTRRVRQGLVALEVGLCTLLLLMAGLLTTSLFHLLGVDTGFAVASVLAADVDLPEKTYSTPATRERFYEEALAGIRALPGVRSVAWVSLLPLEGQGSVTAISLVGEQTRSEQQIIANYRAVSSDYFGTMSIPLVQGRAFTPDDRGKKRVIVSQGLAQRLWPGQNPVGQECIAEWGQLQRSQVIGVVGDIRTAKLDELPLNMVYVPDSYGAKSPGAPSSAAIVVRTANDPRTAASAVRGVIRGVDSGVPIVALRPMRQLISKNVEARRFQMLLASVFGVSALSLACLGIFGVVAYSVERRRQELGVRRALGAQKRDLLALVLRQSMTPVVAGLCAGSAAAIVGGGLVQSLLFEVKAFDPATFGSVIVIVSVVAAISCYIPARRTTRIDPITALRCD